MGTDPFGREIDDDPLKSMGWTTAEGAPATVTPGAEVDEMPAGDETTGGFIGTMPQTDHVVREHPRTIRVGRVGGRLLATLPVLIFLGIIAAFVVPPVIDAINAVEEVTEPFRDGGDDGPAGGSSGPADTRDRSDARDRNGPRGPAPRGLNRTSMLLRGNLSPALRRMRAVTDGDGLIFLRVDADSVDGQVVKGDRVQFVTAESPRSARVWTTGARTGTLKTFRWSQINASAPRRIVEAATVKRGRRATAFDYAVLINTGSTIGLGWSGFMKSGSGTFSANADGTTVSKIG